MKNNSKLRKQQRRADAETRQAHWEGLTNLEKVAILKRRHGERDYMYCREYQKMLSEQDNAYAS